MYLKLSSSLLPPGRLPSISESGWDGTGCASAPSMPTKTQAMKVDRRFHCFGCQADGDVIDFVSRLEAVSPKEAAPHAGTGVFHPL